jgi:hypothetical protein
MLLCFRTSRISVLFLIFIALNPFQCAQLVDDVGDEEVGDFDEVGHCALEWENYAGCIEGHLNMHPAEYTEACKYPKRLYDICRSVSARPESRNKQEQTESKVEDNPSGSITNLESNQVLPVPNNDLVDNTTEVQAQRKKVEDNYQRNTFKLKTDVKGSLMLDGPVRLSILKPLHWQVVWMDENMLEMLLVIFGLDDPVPEDLLLDLYLSRIGPTRYELSKACVAHHVQYNDITKSNLCILKLMAPLQSLGPGPHVIAGRVLSSTDTSLNLGPVHETSFYIKESLSMHSVSTESSYWKVNSQLFACVPHSMQVLALITTDMLPGVQSGAAAARQLPQ